MTEKEFVEKWTGDLITHRIKKFPDDFFSGNDYSTLTIPTCNLLLGEELFGKIEIIDTTGKSIMFTENIYHAKYILYSSYNNIKTIKIPASDLELREVVKSFEIFTEKLLKELNQEFKKEFPKSKNFNEVADKIFNYWGLKRI